MDLSTLRNEFPSLAQTDEKGRPYAYLDAPGGSQVHQSVVEAMEHYLIYDNANHGGRYVTSRRTADTVDEARAAMADFLNAPSPDEIVFGPNMTSLTFHFSRTLARELSPGDEIVVTQLDHDANISPWLRLQERGMVVRFADFDVEDCTLDMDHLHSLINERTRVVAVGYASNAVGTVNDVAKVAEWAHSVGAVAYVDAVHYAPHRPIDVQAIGCDALVCSAYKFFGPHAGILWGKHELLERLHPDKVRPAHDEVPDRYETGTANFEGMAGVRAAVDYLASIGERFGAEFAGQFSQLSGRRRNVKAGLAAIHAYEDPMKATLIERLEAIPGVRLYGITDPARYAWRVPTVSFTLEGHPPAEVAERLGDEGVFVWDGNFYALAPMERLGLEETGGMVRVGLVHYNTLEEVDRLAKVVSQIAATH
jgi:cysteine desulfurase family protein (TIGR01976 family)